MTRQDLLRSIPKVDVVLAHPQIAQLVQGVGHEHVKAFVREELDGLREGVLAGEVHAIPSLEGFCADVARAFGRRGGFHLRRVVNATGIVLHTNLGRAPLGEDFAAHVAKVAAGYSNLELDLESGRRGSRYCHVEDLVAQLTGAEAAMVVNNNAGAVFLMLDTLCKGAGVAISRGELVEIGGSFRVPDIMARSGANLMEVGTTNKTHESDYVRAMDEGATTLLKVHASNFVMQGFTEEVGIAELSALASKRGARVLYDAGAAFLVGGKLLGIPTATSVRKALADGADVVCFSGDKLMGSAQAGFIVGRRELVDLMKGNPLTRMLRIDKLSLAALEATLQASRGDGEAMHRVPALRMLAMGRGECMEQAEELCKLLAAHVLGARFSVVELSDEAGGGSLPGVMLAGAGVAVDPDCISADELERRLRSSEVPVIARIREGRVLLSVRTLLEGDSSCVVAALAEALGAKGAGIMGGGCA